MTNPTNPVTTIVFVTANGPPAAVANGNEIELVITPPGAPVEATILIPLARARDWAAQTYTAVTDAYQDQARVELATTPSPVRIIIGDRSTAGGPDPLGADCQEAS